MSTTCPHIGGIQPTDLPEVIAGCEDWCYPDDIAFVGTRP